MSSPEQTGTPSRKMSALFGPSKARLIALDKGVQKTLENAIARWTEKRIELLEALPENTREELEELGMLQAPTLAIPGAAPAKPVAPQNGRAATSHAAPPPRSRI